MEAVTHCIKMVKLAYAEVIISGAVVTMATLEEGNIRGDTGITGRTKAANAGRLASVGREEGGGTEDMLTE